ncbi:hypothetical protein P43SY_000371 [Pythium insidiosum]|uniref:Uncharacterized protein n=1 Tax=Pythium insidiosum TaxID=114742 RepID=A0AAD5Q8W9_PYTIN|nr:hypothetical protein P43SY_000371 [Pythium insidiosum]
MMAMTPQDKKKLEEIEAAFLEALEPRNSGRRICSPRRRRTSFPVAPVVKSDPKMPKSRGWWSSLKERLVMRAVCCAPPATLLDDGELDQVLAVIEQPIKPKPVARSASRNERFTRRTSAAVMPVIAVSDSKSPADMQATTQDEPTAEPESTSGESTEVSDAEETTDTESSEEELEDVIQELPLCNAISRIVVIEQRALFSAHGDASVRFEDSHTWSLSVSPKAHNPI